MTQLDDPIIGSRIASPLDQAPTMPASAPSEATAKLAGSNAALPQDPLIGKKIAIPATPAPAPQVSGPANERPMGDGYRRVIEANGQERVSTELQDWDKGNTEAHKQSRATGQPLPWQQAPQAAGPVLSAEQQQALQQQQAAADTRNAVAPLGPEQVRQGDHAVSLQSKPDAGIYQATHHVPGATADDIAAGRLTEDMHPELHKQLQVKPGEELRQTFDEKGEPHYYAKDTKAGTVRDVPVKNMTPDEDAAYEAKRKEQDGAAYRPLQPQTREIASARIKTSAQTGKAEFDQFTARADAEALGAGVNDGNWTDPLRKAGRRAGLDNDFVNSTPVTRKPFKQAGDFWYNQATREALARAQMALNQGDSAKPGPAQDAAYAQAKMEYSAATAHTLNTMVVRAIESGHPEIVREAMDIVDGRRQSVAPSNGFVAAIVAAQSSLKNSWGAGGGWGGTSDGTADIYYQQAAQGNAEANSVGAAIGAGVGDLGSPASLASFALTAGVGKLTLSLAMKIAPTLTAERVALIAAGKTAATAWERTALLTARITQDAAFGAISTQAKSIAEKGELASTGDTLKSAGQMAAFGGLSASLTGVAKQFPTLQKPLENLAKTSPKLAATINFGAKEINSAMSMVATNAAAAKLQNRPYGANELVTDIALGLVYPVAMGGAGEYTDALTATKRMKTGGLPPHLFDEQFSKDWDQAKTIKDPMERMAAQRMAITMSLGRSSEISTGPAAEARPVAASGVKGAEPAGPFTSSAENARRAGGTPAADVPAQQIARQDLGDTAGDAANQAVSERYAPPKPAQSVKAPEQPKPSDPITIESLRSKADEMAKSGTLADAKIAVKLADLADHLESDGKAKEQAAQTAQQAPVEPVSGVDGKGGPEPRIDSQQPQQAPKAAEPVKPEPVAEPAAKPPEVSQDQPAPATIPPVSEQQGGGRTSPQQQTPAATSGKVLADRVRTGSISMNQANRAAKEGGYLREFREAVGRPMADPVEMQHKQSQRDEANSAKVQGLVGHAESLVQGVGGKPEYVSEYGSKYFTIPATSEHGEISVRISDHAVPQTPERAYQKDAGFGPKWRDIVITPDMNESSVRRQLELNLPEYFDQPAPAKSGGTSTPLPSKAETPAPATGDKTSPTEAATGGKAGASEAKEPWRMSLKAFRAKDQGLADAQRRYSDYLDPSVRKNTFEHGEPKPAVIERQQKELKEMSDGINKDHRASVEQAIREGKITSHPDYPDLKSTSPAPAPSVKDSAIVENASEGGQGAGNKTTTPSASDATIPTEGATNGRSKTTPIADAGAPQEQQQRTERATDAGVLPEDSGAAQRRTKSVAAIRSVLGRFKGVTLHDDGTNLHLEMPDKARIKVSLIDTFDMKPEHLEDYLASALAANRGKPIVTIDRTAIRLPRTVAEWTALAQNVKQKILNEFVPGGHYSPKDGESITVTHGVAEDPSMFAEEVFHAQARRLKEADPETYRRTMRYYADEDAAFHGTAHMPGFWNAPKSGKEFFKRIRQGVAHIEPTNPNYAGPKPQRALSPMERAKSQLIGGAMDNGVLMSDADMEGFVNDMGGLHPDVLDAHRLRDENGRIKRRPDGTPMLDAVGRKLEKFVNEDGWSNAVESLSYEQAGRLQDRIVNEVTMNASEKLQMAAEFYMHPNADPRLRALAEKVLGRKVEMSEQAAELPAEALPEVADDVAPFAVRKSSDQMRLLGGNGETVGGTKGMFEKGKNEEKVEPRMWQVATDKGSKRILGETPEAARAKAESHGLKVLNVVPAKGMEERASEIAKPAESDQQVTHREWRENFERVQDDVQTATARDLLRASAYAGELAHAEVRTAKEANRPVNQKFHDAMRQEAKDLAFMSRQRESELGLDGRPSPVASVVRPADPQDLSRLGILPRNLADAKAFTDNPSPAFAKGSKLALLGRDFSDANMSAAEATEARKGFELANEKMTPEQKQRAAGIRRYENPPVADKRDAQIAKKFGGTESASMFAVRRRNSEGKLIPPIFEDLTGVKKARGYTPPETAIAEPPEPMVQGAAGRQEPLLPKAAPGDEPALTGIKNAAMDETRRMMGLSEVERGKHLSVTGVHADIGDLVERDPHAGERLVASLLTTPRSLESHENMLLTYEANRLRIERNVAEADMETAIKAGDEAAIMAAKAHVTKSQTDFDNLSEVSKKMGTLWGQSGRFRQEMMKEDYSLAAMERRWTIAKGDKLDPAELAEVKKLAADLQIKLDEQSTTIKEQTERAAKAEADLELARTKFAAAQRKANAKPTASPNPADASQTYGTKNRLFTRDRYEQAKRKLLDSGITYSGIPADKMLALAEMGAFHIEAGARTLADFTARMVADLGEKIKPHLQDIHAAAINMMADAEKKNLTDKMKARLDDGASLSQLQPYLKKLARELVNRGVNERESLIEALHNSVKDILPDATREQVRDAWTGYGQFKLLDKSADLVTLRDLQQQSQKVAQLEDLVRGEAPKASGFERQAPSDETRAITKQVNEKKKELGIVNTNPETHLKTVVQSTVTRLQNSINDLQREIDLGERTVKGKTIPISTPEIDALRRQLADLRKLHEATVSPIQMTDEQRLQLATKAAERQAEMAEQTLADARQGKFNDPTGKFSWTNEQIIAAKARAKAARMEVEQLKQLANPPKTASERRAEAIQKQIDDLEAKIQSGDPAPTNRIRQGPETAAVDALKRQRDALRDKLNNMRASDPVLQAKEVVDAYDRQAAEYERKAREGEYTKPDAPAKPSTMEMELAKARRDAAKKYYDEARAKDPAYQQQQAEASNRAYRTAIARRMAEIQDRIASDDYTPKEQRQRRFELDPESQKSQVELEKLKNLDRAKQRQFEMANRSTLEKIADKMVQVGRAGVLSYPSVFEKLGAAAIARTVLEPVESGVGGVLSRIPGISRIAARAPRHGRFSPTAEAKAITDGLIRRGAAESWKKLKAGHSDIDVLYGDKVDVAEPQSVLDVFGHMHGALKEPVRQAEWARSFQMRMEHALKNGEDVSNPAVQLRIGKDAYLDANRAIFMQPNVVAKAYNIALNYLDKHGGKPLATVLRLALPIVKVPTNIVAETMDYALGSVTGSAKAGRALAKGVEKLTPEQADTIMRQLKKGSMGAAIMLAGYYGAGAVGGFYQKGKKRDETDVPEGSIRIAGVDVPKIVLHHPLFEALQIGATMQRVWHSKARRTDSDVQGPSESVLAAALGLVESVPFVREMVDISDVLDPTKRENAMGRIIGSRLVPGIVSQPTKYFDTTDKGEPVARRPKGILQTAMAGVPGARQMVPQAAEGNISHMDAQRAAKAYSGATKDVQGKVLADVQKKIVNSQSDEMKDAHDAIKAKIKKKQTLAPEDIQRTQNAAKANEDAQDALMERHGIPKPPDLDLTRLRTQLSTKAGIPPAMEQERQQQLAVYDNSETGSPEHKQADARLTEIEAEDAKAKASLSNKEAGTLDTLNDYHQKKGELEKALKGGMSQREYDKKLEALRDKVRKDIKGT